MPFRSSNQLSRNSEKDILRACGTQCSQVRATFAVGANGKSSRGASEQRGLVLGPHAWLQGCFVSMHFVSRWHLWMGQYIDNHFVVCVLASPSSARVGVCGTEIQYGHNGTFYPPHTWRSTLACWYRIPARLGMVLAAFPRQGLTEQARMMATVYAHII